MCRLSLTDDYLEIFYYLLSLDSEIIFIKPKLCILCIYDMIELAGISKGPRNCITFLNMIIPILGDKQVLNIKTFKSNSKLQIINTRW